MKDLNELETLIIGWAKARGIVPNATPESQVLKAVSEMGELADATAKRRYHEMRDAIGDIVVCLVNLCALQGWTLSECLNEAWEQIKDRKGTLLPNGCFVKEEPQSKQKNHELEGYLDGKRAGYKSGGTLGAEWYANNSNLTGTAKEDYISGFNAAIDEVEQKEESK